MSEAWYSPCSQYERGMPGGKYLHLENCCTNCMRLDDKTFCPMLQIRCAEWMKGRFLTAYQRNTS